MDKTFICDICGEIHPVDQRTTFDGQELCSHCLDENTLLCRQCNTRIWSDNNEGSDDHPLCPRCYDRFFTNCSRCGALLLNEDAQYIREDDDDYPYCDNCFERQSRNGIHEYHYKPKPYFYGEGNRFFGIELEIDGAGENGSNARKLLEIGNIEDNLFYCKRDGSLDEGFEIVTHPMTLQFHQNSMPWDEIMHKAIRMGYYSHQANTCGLHIHVNRDSLGSTLEQQEDSIARANQRIKKSTEEVFADTVVGYSSVVPESSSVAFQNGTAKYALFPVWLLNTTWNGTKYTFAMNGQTGKMVGDLPMDKGAYKRWLFGLAGAVGAGVFLLLTLFWLL